MSMSLPASQDICAIVAEELALVGGAISETHDGGERLFLRSLLPMTEEVQPKDVVQGGIAVMADEAEIHVHPYLLRKVCQNGAIMPQLLEDRNIQRVNSAASTDDIEAVEVELREAVRACSTPEVFSHGVKHFSVAAMNIADPTIFWLLLGSSSGHERLRAEILQRFLRNRDRSAFGLVNAVTSVARDQKNPEVRWRLEELGGGMLAKILPRDKPGGCEAETREEVEVCS